MSDPAIGKIVAGSASRGPNLPVANCQIPALLRGVVLGEWRC